MKSSKKDSPICCYLPLTILVAQVFKSFCYNFKVNTKGLELFYSADYSKKSIAALLHQGIITTQTSALHYSFALLYDYITNCSNHQAQQASGQYTDLNSVTKGTN